MIGNLLKIQLFVSFAILCFFACCGDSSNGAEVDVMAETKTIYGLGDCRGVNEGVTKLVTSENKYYTCEDGRWTSRVDTEVVDKSSSSKFTPKSSEAFDDSWTVDGGESSGSEFEGGNDDSCSSCFFGDSAGSTYDEVIGTLVDSRNSRSYRIVVIGTQTWMAENLNYKTENSWCGGGFGMTEGDCLVYGRLYTWAAAVGRDEDECGYGHDCDLDEGNVRGVCPQGWHLPSYDEWKSLFDAVGGRETAATMLKSTSGWADNFYTLSGVQSGNGTDAYSFSALPAGNRGVDGGFYNKGGRTCFWTAREYKSRRAYYMRLDPSSYADLSNYLKTQGYSVRCLKD